MYATFFFVVYLVFAPDITAMSEEFRQLVTQIHNDCRDEVGAPEGIYRMKCIPSPTETNYYKVLNKYVAKNEEIGPTITFEIDKPFQFSFKKMIQGLQTGNFVEDERQMCYLKCTFRKANIMDADGNIDMDRMISCLPPELDTPATQKVLRDCGIIEGKDACETAWLSNRCYQAGNKEMYFIP